MIEHGSPLPVFSEQPHRPGMEGRESESYHNLEPPAAACARLLAPTFFASQEHPVLVGMTQVYSVHRLEGQEFCLLAFDSLSKVVDPNWTQHTEPGEHWEWMRIGLSDGRGPGGVGRRVEMQAVGRSL